MDDEIRIKVVVDDNKASKKLTTLSNNLSQLSSAAKSLSGVQGLSDTVDQLSASLGKLSSIKISKTVSTNLSLLGDAIQKFGFNKSVSFSKTADSLAKLSEVKITKSVGTSIENIATAIEKFGDIQIPQEVVETLKSISEIKIQSGIGNNIKTLVEALEKISSVEPIKAELVNNLKGLSEVRISSSIANGLNNIATALPSLAGLDMSKLRELVDILSNLKGVGNINIRIKDGQAVASTSKPKTPDTNTFPGNGEFEDVKAQVNKTNEHLKKSEQESSALKGVLEGAAAAGSKLAAAVTIAKKVFEALKPIVEGVFGVIKKIASTIASIGVKGAKFLVSPFTLMGKAVGNVLTKMKELWSSLKRIAMYRAFRSLIKMFPEGFAKGIQNLYAWSYYNNTGFAKSMDVYATDLLYLRNSMAALAEPIINKVIPAFDKVVDIVVEIFNKISETIALLSGADTWTKALKKGTTYAEEQGIALDKLKRSLIGLDEINKLNDKESSGISKEDVEGMFSTEEVKTDFNKTFTNAFEGLLNAWNTSGKKALEEMQSAWESILTLVTSVKNSFKTVFESGQGEATLTSIFNIIGNISASIGNLATKFNEAWVEGDKGTAIVSNIWETVNSLIGGFETLTGMITKWTKGLNFNPITESFKDFTSAVKEFVGTHVDNFNWVWENILLPLSSWVIDEAAPKSVNVLKTAIQTLDNVLSPVIDGFKDFWNETEDLRKSIGVLISGVLNDLAIWLKGFGEHFQKSGTVDRIKTYLSEIGRILLEEIKTAIVEIKKKFEAFVLSGGFDMLMEGLFYVVRFLVEAQGYAHALGKELAGVYHYIRAAAQILQGNWTGAVAEFELGDIEFELAEESVNNTKTAVSALSGLFKEVSDAVYDATLQVKAFDEAAVNSGTEYGKILAKYKKNYSDTANEILTSAKKTNDDITNSATTTWSSVSTSVTTSADDQQTSINNLGNWISGTAAPDMMRSFMQTYTTASDSAETSASDTKNSIDSIVDKFKNSFEPSVTTASITGFTNFTIQSNSAFDGLSDNLADVPGEFDDAFTQGYNNAKSALSGGGSLADGITDGVNSSFKSLLNSIIYRINNALYKIFDAINEKIRSLNQLDIFGLKPFENLKTITVPQISYLATGGIVKSGEMFVANEMGPELVGRYGNKSAVMNNDQIVESVTNGVAMANASQNQLLREQNHLLRELLNKESNVRAVVSTSDIINGLNAVNKRTGRQVVSVNI